MYVGIAQYLTNTYTIHENASPIPRNNFLATPAETIVPSGQPDPYKHSWRDGAFLSSEGALWWCCCVEYTNAPIDSLAYNVTDVVQAKQAFSRGASIYDAVESTSVMTKTSYKFAHEKLLLDQMKCLIGSWKTGTLNFSPYWNNSTTLGRPAWLRKNERS